MGKISLASENPPSNLPDLVTWIASFAKDVVQQVNGNLTFPDNFKCDIVNVSFATAGTDTVVKHRLGRVPTGFLLINSNLVLSVYRGSQPMTANFITLRGSAIAEGTLLIF